MMIVIILIRAKKDSSWNGIYLSPILYIQLATQTTFPETETTFPEFQVVRMFCWLEQQVYGVLPLSLENYDFQWRQQNLNKVPSFCSQFTGSSYLVAIQVEALCYQKTSEKQFSFKLQSYCPQSSILKGLHVNTVHVHVSSCKYTEGVSRRMRRSTSSDQLSLRQKVRPEKVCPPAAAPSQLVSLLPILIEPRAIDRHGR